MRQRAKHERGQVVVVFALLIPVFLGIGAIVIGIGNWYTHAKHLQTKADASALAGGTAFGFPCGPPGSDVDQAIEQQARTYLGPHTPADPAQLPFTSTTFNPQVGGVGASQIHAVFNGSAWYDDDSNPLPTERNDPLNASICQARILDVKATEDNSFPLFSLIPLYPDIKRKARVQIEHGSEFGAMLPIAVRVPKPVSAAAIFYDESSANGDIIATRYLREVCWLQVPAPCLGNIPAGLGQWTTDGASLGNASLTMSSGQVGVVIALSFRPACPDPAPGPCFSIDTAAYPTVNAMCNQGSSTAVAQCSYATGAASQTVESGLQFIRGYTNVSLGPGDAPGLEDVWLTAGALAPNCYNSGYFSAPVSNSCFGTLNAEVLHNATAGNVEIRYKLVAGNTSWAEDDPPGPCGNNYNNGCDITNGPASVEFVSQYARHAFAIRVRLQNTAVTGVPACNDNGFDANCEWFFTASTRSTNPPTNQQIFDNPVQRGFMGNIDRSGSVKYLHLYQLNCADGGLIAGLGETGPAASVEQSAGPGDPRCFKVEMGLQGSLAKDQDEPPIQLNIGASSQSSVLDCDPDISNLKDEIVQGCGKGFPKYKAHDFAVTPYCPTWNGINDFFSLPKPDPWEDWDPFTCVATQTASAPNQVVQGLNERFFGVPGNPSCPIDDAALKPGRNYWHDENNSYDDPVLGEDYYTFAQDSRSHGNMLVENEDPRYVLLFMTPYNSFTGNGNEIYPVSLIGAFYITGYGRILGNGTLINEDPCDDGNGLAVGAGNVPPADIDTSNSNAVAWGHFVQPVDLGTSSGGTGVLCGTTGDPQPCVVVLVE